MVRQRKQQPSPEGREGGHAKADSADQHDAPTPSAARPLPEYADPVDDTLDDTFPASDPPSWPGLTLGRS